MSSTRSNAVDDLYETVQVNNNAVRRSGQATNPSDLNLAERSCVEYYGSGVNSCGYCKRDEDSSGEGRRTYDMKAHRLRATDYQLLLDKGWRRSGDYCYYPINNSTCCPNYPISCKALEFKLSRSQRKCIENMNSFLVNGDNNTHNGQIKFKLNYDHHQKQQQETSNNNNDNQSGGIRAPYLERIADKSLEQLEHSVKARDKRFLRSCKRKAHLNNKNLDEAFQIVRQKWLRARRREPVLEDYLYPRQSAITTPLPKAKHKLEIRLQHVESAGSKLLRQEEHQLIQRYQRHVHKEGPSQWSMSRYCDFLVKTPLIVEPMEDRDYLSIEPCTRSSSSSSSSSAWPPPVVDGDALRANVCPDPTKYLLVRPPDLPTAFGTYHCTYHLDERLIAVGVLDILPKCVTTVYFFYEPSYEELNLGIYSALVEIAMVRQIASHYKPPGDVQQQLQQQQPQQQQLQQQQLQQQQQSQFSNKLVHYYMGFYVHECRKMRYKVTFKPSYLLCWETNKFVPTELCLQKLIGRKYARFADDSDEDLLSEARRRTPILEDIILIPVQTPALASINMIDYLRWLEASLGVEYVDILINNILIQYVRLVGRPLIGNLILRVNAVHRALVERHRRLTAGNRSSLSGADNSSEQANVAATSSNDDDDGDDEENGDNDN